MNIAVFKESTVARLRLIVSDLQELIAAHPKNLPTSNAVLDELLRLKLEVARSLDRLA